MILATPEQVTACIGINELPEYFDIELITDAPGFAVRRLYPADNELARVRNQAGEQLMSCIIQFIVETPKSPHGTGAVTLRAWMWARWRKRRLFSNLSELDPADPDTPTSDSIQRLRRARKPIQVDFVGKYLYDAGADHFTDEDGNTVTPATMLNDVYQAHCRTMRTYFVWRWTVGTFVRWAARNAVWRGQDVCIWLLLHLYDVEISKPHAQLSPFHTFRRSDFVRSAEIDGQGSTFFGFESSRRNLFTNLLALAVAGCLMYRYAPRGGFIEAVYRNPALTTAALLLGFFMADVVGPWLFIAPIYVLSRLRPFVMFLYRKVKP